MKKFTNKFQLSKTLRFELIPQGKTLENIKSKGLIAKDDQRAISYKKMKSLKLKLLAARIELHWWFIRRQRQKGNKLLESGFPHSSERLLALNRSFSKHCAQAMKAQREYERASGIHLYAEQMRA